jgi:hypothetical protein
MKIDAMSIISGNDNPSCIKCGNSDIRVLTINHLNGFHKMQRPENEGSTPLYHRIVKGTRKTDDLEIRCYNCNVLYEFEIGKRFFYIEQHQNKAVQS